MTSADSDQAQRSDSSASKKLGLAVAILTLLTAGFGVLSAYLGFQAAELSKQEKQAQAAAASSGAQASALQAQNGDLQQQNNDLRSQLGAPSASNRPNQPASERHSGQVTASATGPALDLDSPKSDDQWGANGSDSRPDLHYDTRGNLTLGYYGQVANLDETLATYDVCKTHTGYSTGSSAAFAGGDLRAGQYFCVKTDANRYSAVKILSIEKAQATFDIVTYDPPFK